MKIKRIISAVIAAVIMLSLTISASAESLEDLSTKIELNKTYQATATEDYADNTFKFTISSKTTIKLTVNTDFEYLGTILYNKDGEVMSSKNRKSNSGRWYDSIISDATMLEWNEKVEKGAGTVEYTLLAGTYYIQFHKSYGDGGQDLLFKISDPNAASVTALSLSLTVDAGETLNLGGIVTPSNAKITWKSSDSEVATVSSSGEVEALKAGKAKITATAGGKTASITIIVN
jgi:uncharacterized protein YjdB